MTDAGIQKIVLESYELFDQINYLHSLIITFRNYSISLTNAVVHMSTGEFYPTSQAIWSVIPRLPYGIFHEVFIDIIELSCTIRGFIYALVTIRNSRLIRSTPLQNKESSTVLDTFVHDCMIFFRMNYQIMYVCMYLLFRPMAWRSRPLTQPSKKAIAPYL
jgi:hypothetical protein